MVISPVDIVVCVVGLVLYFLPASKTDAKVNEVGRMMFFAGLLAWLLSQGGHVLHLG